jgi:hypothetical protein
MHGSGKTSLLHNYLPHLKTDEATMIILQLVGASEHTMADLKAMQSAVTVLVKCGPTADGVLQCLVSAVIAACELDPRAMAVETHGLTIAASLTKVLKMARRTHAIFLGIDEIGRLGGQESDRDQAAYDEYHSLRCSLLMALRDSTWPVAGSLARPPAGIPAASKPVHVIVVGGGVSLDVADRLLHHRLAPRTSRRVYLKALAVPHVEEIIDHYQLQLALAEQANPSSRALRLALATAVRNATAGCPRTVHHMLSIIKVLQLDISSRDAIGTAVADVAVALAKTDQPSFAAQRHRVDSPAQLASYADLAMCSMLDIELKPCFYADPEDPKVVLQNRLLDRTMNLPTMFETTTDGYIPRVSAVLTAGLREMLGQIKQVSFSKDAVKLLLPHKEGIIAAVQRGLLPHYLAGLLDPKHVLPLQHLVPFLPDEHRAVYVRASCVVPHLQLFDSIKTLSIDHFRQIPEPAAADPEERMAVGPPSAAAAGVRAAAVLSWSQNPAHHGKVLLVSLCSKSPTADCFVWVPAAAQCGKDGLALRSARDLLLQLKSDEAIDGAGTSTGYGEVSIDKALLHSEVDAVLVVLAKKSKKNKKAWKTGESSREVKNTGSGPVDVIVVPENQAKTWVVAVEQ